MNILNFLGFGGKTEVEAVLPDSFTCSECLLRYTKNDTLSATKSDICTSCLDPVYRREKERNRLIQEELDELQKAKQKDHYDEMIQSTYEWYMKNKITEKEINDLISATPVLDSSDYAEFVQECIATRSYEECEGCHIRFFVSEPSDPFRQVKKNPYDADTILYVTFIVWPHEAAIDGDDTKYWICNKCEHDSELDF